MNITYAVPNITFNGSDLILKNYVCPNLAFGDTVFTLCSAILFVLIAAKLLTLLNQKYKFTTYDLSGEEIVLIIAFYILVADYPLNLIQMIIIGSGMYLYYFNEINKIVRFVESKLKSILGIFKKVFQR